MRIGGHHLHNKQKHRDGALVLDCRRQAVRSIIITSKCSGAILSEMAMAESMS